MVINPVSGDPTSVNCVWYYTYKAKLYDWSILWPIEFIPTVKDLSMIDDIRPGSAPPVIFTFNEPDVPTSTVYMPVKALITKLWPKVVAMKAKKVVCPSVTKRHLYTWMADFLQGNGTYVPSCDYINIHWYDVTAQEFLDHIDLAWATFKLPMYVTEFGMADWKAAKFGYPTECTTDDLHEFINIAIRGLESRPYIKAYAYYSRTDVIAQEFASLWNTDRTPRAAAFVYAGLGSKYNSTGSNQIGLKGSHDDEMSLTILILVILFPVSFFIAVCYIIYSYQRTGAAISKLDASETKDPHINLYL
jgi:Glycosyl hydrolase catalytic core